MSETFHHSSTAVRTLRPSRGLGAGVGVKFLERFWDYVGMGQDEDYVRVLPMTSLALSTLRSSVKPLARDTTSS